MKEFISNSNEITMKALLDIPTFILNTSLLELSESSEDDKLHQGIHTVEYFSNPTNQPMEVSNFIECLKLPDLNPKKIGDSFNSGSVGNDGSSAAQEGSSTLNPTSNNNMSSASMSPEVRRMDNVTSPSNSARESLGFISNIQRSTIKANLELQFQCYVVTQWASYVPYFRTLSMVDRIMLIRGSWNELLLAIISFRSQFPPAENADWLCCLTGYVDKDLLQRYGNQTVTNFLNLTKKAQDQVQSVKNLSTSNSPASSGNSPHLLNQASPVMSNGSPVVPSPGVCHLPSPSGDLMASPKNQELGTAQDVSEGISGGRIGEPNHEFDQNEMIKKLTGENAGIYQRIRMLDNMNNNIFEKIQNELVLKMKRYKYSLAEIHCVMALILYNPDTKTVVDTENIRRLRDAVYLTLDVTAKSNDSTINSTRLGQILLLLPSIRSLGLQCCRYVFPFFARCPSPSQIQQAFERINY
jgi:hypothetical protein